MVWHGSAKTQAGKALISEDQRLRLVKLAEESDYWKTAKSFIESIEGRWLGSLSLKQLEWYNDIDAKLDWEVDRHEGRIAWGEEKDE